MRDIRIKSDNLRFKYINRFIIGKDVLDLASSEGFLHELLIKKNPLRRIYSCDFKDSDFNKDLNKPFNLNKKFDTIIAGEIIEHLKNPSKFLEECRRILNKGGRLILTTPNATGLQYILNPSWCIEDYDNPPHISCFTLPMFKKIISNTPLKILHVEYINAFWRYNPLQLVSLIVKRLRTDLFIVAEK